MRLVLEKSVRDGGSGLETGTLAVDEAGFGTEEEGGRGYGGRGYRLPAHIFFTSQIEYSRSLRTNERPDDSKAMPPITTSFGSEAGGMMDRVGWGRVRFAGGLVRCAAGL
jgi:hypothetical protein